MKSKHRILVNGKTDCQATKREYNLPSYADCANCVGCTFDLNSERYDGNYPECKSPDVCSAWSDK